LNESERNLYENTDTSSIKFAFEDADLDDEEQAAINPYHDLMTAFPFTPFGIKFYPIKRRN
jgi:hypothetical protein